LRGRQLGECSAHHRDAQGVRPIGITEGPTAGKRTLTFQVRANQQTDLSGVKQNKRQATLARRLDNVIAKLAREIEPCKSRLPWSEGLLSRLSHAWPHP